MRFFLTFALVVISPAVSIAADIIIGERVFLKDGAEAKLGDTVVNCKLIPFPATVGDVEGELLWLLRAWVRKGDVMSMAEAM